MIPFLDVTLDSTHEPIVRALISRNILNANNDYHRPETVRFNISAYLSYHDEAYESIRVELHYKYNYLTKVLPMNERKILFTLEKLIKEKETELRRLTTGPSLNLPPKLYAKLFHIWYHLFNMFTKFIMLKLRVLEDLYNPKITIKSIHNSDNTYRVYYRDE